MELNMSFPREIAKVKENRIPVVICGGTVEYHGPHCSYGCDTLVAEGLIKKLAETKEIAENIVDALKDFNVETAITTTVRRKEI